MSNPVSKVEEVAKGLLTGILSNPNYNFENAKKVADVAVNHAEALLNKIEDLGKQAVHAVAVTTEKTAGKVSKGAAVVQDQAKKVADKTADPLSNI